MARLRTGATTTCKVLKSNPQKDTSTYVPANQLVSVGVINTAPRVEHIVIETERATSAQAIKVTTLLAVPPGQQATRINPTANTVSR